MGIKELSKSKKKRKNIVSFDEEIVTKDSAVSYLAESSKILENEYKGKISHDNNSNGTHSKKKIKKRKQGRESNEKPNEEGSVEESLSTEIASKKRKKNKKSGELVTKLEPEESEEAEQNSLTEIQSKKRKKSKKSGELEIKPEPEESEEAEQNLLTELQNKKRKKSKKSGELEIKPEPEENEGAEQNSSIEIQNKKRKKNKKSGELETKPDLEENEAVSAEKSTTKKENSIRALKRMKHEKLVEEKRLKAATITQQNVLNYLSKWKHAREEWKFEKLKQIWLQQSLFDCNKIPNEFWDTAVDYFNGSKGFIRKCVLRDALKIIEKAESVQEENADENHHLVLKRAQDIIQNLQE